MAFPRTQHQLTVLPDGSVLATGGSRNSDVSDRANAVLAAELWNPTTETWTTLSSGVAPRLYHSFAVLLPDGRVALGGGGHPPGFGVDEYRSEIYSPPYLFKGARPTITSAPSQASYGQSFFVATPDGATITKAALIPQPVVTHAKNAASGYIPLTFSQTAGGLTVTAPPNGNIAPPGKFMLFLVNASGVPSVASWVTISAPGGGGSLSSLSFESASKQRVLSSQDDQAPVTPPAPSTLSIFGGAPIGAPASLEASGLRSYPKRLVCKVDAGRREVKVPESRGPP
jgi:hypothetical protein